MSCLCDVWFGYDFETCTRPVLEDAYLSSNGYGISLLRLRCCNRDASLYSISRKSFFWWWIYWWWARLWYSNYCKSRFIRIVAPYKRSSHETQTNSHKLLITWVIATRLWLLPSDLLFVPWSHKSWWVREINDQLWEPNKCDHSCDNQ